MNSWVSEVTCQSGNHGLTITLNNWNGAQQGLGPSLSNSPLRSVRPVVVADFMGTNVDCVLPELSVRIRGKIYVMLGGDIG